MSDTVRDTGAPDVPEDAVLERLSTLDRFLPLWIGVVAALFAIVPVGLVTATGLPGFPGVIDPFGLVIIGGGLAFTFWKQAVGRSGRPVAAATEAALAS